MARKLLPDDLWAVAEPLPPPPPPPSPKGGRPRLGDRQALTGILFVLRTGLPWGDLPAELGCGCGMSCRRRRRDWQADGTRTRVHGERLARRHAAGKLGRSKTVTDSSSVRAVWGGAATGPNPTGRGEAGSEHHVLTDRGGVPPAATVPAANAHDIRGLLPAVVARPPAGDGSPGRRPRQSPGDRADRLGWHEGVLRWLGIRPRLARPGAPHGSGLGKHRWVAERTIAHLHQNRRLKVRYERRAAVHQGFLTLACIRLCWPRLCRWC